MKFIRLADVISATALSKSSIYLLMKKGEFPKSFKLSERSVAWLQTDIDEWIESRVSKRGAV